MINISAQANTSVLKNKAIYSDLLLKEGYKWYQIEDLAISEFVEFEHERIGEPADLHLLAIKKILLYAIPVIASPLATHRRGITLTAQFNTECIVNDTSNNRRSLAPGDKYILVGFAFAPTLVNHIAFNLFPWKYYNKYPQEYIPAELDLSHLEGIQTQSYSNIHKLYLIETSFYEDINLYNKILHLVKLKLDEYTHARTLIQAQCDETNHKNIEAYQPPTPIIPLNDIPIIPKLNQILEKQIDPTFMLSYYDTLQSTANWLLSNQIFLYGYDSSIVSAYLDRLRYIKKENHKVFLRVSKETQTQLEQTRAEKITREQFPFYFSQVDRRGIFTRFNRFALDKLTKPHQAEVRMLLDKELAYQRALIENKCPHIKLVKRVATDHSMYKELEAFVDFDRKTDADHIYHCKNCGYQILCEHEVEFYSNVLISKESTDDNDHLYDIQQNIINRFKSIQQPTTQADAFTYFCKYCFAELGKSSDIIQVSSTIGISYAQTEHTELRNMIYYTLANILSTNVDPLILQMNKKKVLKALLGPIEEHVEDVIRPFHKLKDNDSIDRHTVLSILIMSLSALISLNVNVLKSTGTLLNAEIIKKIVPKIKDSSGSSTEESSEESSEDESDQEQPAIVGGSIKHEFANAFAIIKNSSQYRNLLVSDDKIKAMLIDYYRRISKDIGDLVDIRSMVRSTEERVVLEVRQSAIYAYLRYMISRNKGIVVSDLPFETVLGTTIRNPKKSIEIEEYLFNNLPDDTIKRSDARAKYIKESFQNIRSFLVNGTYRGTDIEPVLAKSIQDYEIEQHKYLIDHTKNPQRFLPDINSREFEFVLTNLNLIYCATTSVISRHQWVDGICSVCNISIKKISPTHNKHIEALIDRSINKDAFFELYVINCPVKDMHIFTNNTCIQCGVSKQQLLAQDAAYYEQYMPKFTAYQTELLAQLLLKANSVVQLKSYSSPSKPILHPTDVEVDINKNALIISKVFEVKQSDLTELSDKYLDSYLKLVYERYAYAKNASYDMAKHSDIEFYDFIRTNFFERTRPIQIDMPELPLYDYQNYTKNVKLYQLLRLFSILIETNLQPIITLGNFLIRKILAQESRRKAFNFAKLKAFRSEPTEEQSLVLEPLDEEDEDNDGNDTSLFMAYDIDMDDIDDNIEGDLD